MKIRFALLTLLATAFLPQVASAGNFTLDYANDSGDVDYAYVIFTGGWAGTFNGTPIANFDSSNSTATSYAVPENGSISFNITATGGRAYVLYGNDSLTNYASSGAGQPSAGASNYRYSFSEWGFTGTSGTTDLSEIDQFGGSVAMNVTSSSGSPVVSIYNTMNTGDAMRAIMSSASLSPTSPAVVTSSPGGTGNFLSIVGPSTSTVTSAYSTFSNYLSYLKTSNNNSFLSNNAPNDGGIGLNNVINNGNGTFSPGNQTWIATYSFNTTVTASNIIYNGSVLLYNGNDPSSNITYNGLYVIEPRDGNLATGIYSGNPSSTTTFGDTGANISINGTEQIGNTSAWNGLNNYVNSTNTSLIIPAANLTTVANLGGNSVVNLKVIGDYMEGLNVGFVGNPNSTIANLSSANWFGNIGYAYTNGTAGLTSGNYNQFGIVNFLASDTAFGNGTIVSGGAIYTSPYDDRFGQNLLGFDANGTVTITLLSDGNMAVPEPSTSAALGATVAVLAAGYRRIRRPKSRRPASSA